MIVVNDCEYFVLAYLGLNEDAQAKAGQFLTLLNSFKSMLLNLRVNDERIFQVLVSIHLQPALSTDEKVTVSTATVIF